MAHIWYPIERNNDIYRKKSLLKTISHISKNILREGGKIFYTYTYLSKNAVFVFLGPFWGYVRQPHDYIGWATSMFLSSINPTNLKTNPWNFNKIVLRICDFGK